MGSSGSGRISDYPGSSSQEESNGDGGSKGGKDDRCARAFNVILEDVEQSDYFKTHGSVPPVGAQLNIAQRKRLVAQTATGESVGNLPTSHNYLAACIKNGWTYEGTVQNSAMRRPVATVAADFAAIPPR
jgi:hypothetical protein